MDWVTPNSPRRFPDKRVKEVNGGWQPPAKRAASS
jgi:hypothetical protein